MLALERQNKKLLIPTFHSVEVVNIGYIIHIEALENYCKIHLSHGEPIISTYSIGDLAIMLTEYGFYQCHKSFIVNLTHIRRYLKTYNIEMVSSASIPVARRRKDGLMAELRGWFGEILVRQSA